MVKDIVRLSVVAAGLAVGLGLASAAPSPRPGGSLALPQSGSVTGRQPLPPASMAVPKGQRTFKRCNREAMARKLRGADRRHFVKRCRLGYGHRLFRRGRAAPH
ncbi:PsiF family protein [Enterovirga rhinocerotis]|uniref:PsiF repeat-containing protein n=1 Tax=Enterovirga rhinocerotis TaxID=1339210 RepID=A0A4R7CB90_9HYPH|nr:PsiF family protein [Enterovirga rhinocerotis]TDR94336.1 psiF repeat-containing protein [Enterovirga rhinocerotis]